MPLNRIEDGSARVIANILVPVMSQHDNQNQRIRTLMDQARAVAPELREAWLSALEESPELLDALREALDREGMRTAALTTDLDETLVTAQIGSDRDLPPGAPVKDPETIGPYEIRRRLGEGGFGVVYLGHQEHPIRRDVAIKVVQAGMQTGNVLVRFEAERQTLALMSHPGVAKVIDAGTTDSGAPFFVMEYVDGKPIDELCDEVDLDVEGRIRLFIEVCEAIQHAHGKGIIHRDLKPGNILVSIDGKRLLPHVIDFGIAKALDPEIIGTGAVTMEGQFIGTPHYMAPEQTGFLGQDVDARADVFSLGAVLYELLVGRAPVDSDTIAKARGEGGVAALQRVLCEQPPLRPSQALARMDRDAPLMAEDVAARRGVDVRGLRRSLQGDLDWILLRSLERDRDRRYETPLGFAADLRRHLAHQPVEAGPPSRRYRFSKFVRRNRVGVTAMLVIFLVLIGSAVFSNAARLAAERRLQETESTLAFVDNSIDAIDPSSGGGRDLTAVDYFADAYREIARDESLSPWVQVRLYVMYSRVLLALGEYEQGELSARAGIEIIESNSFDYEIAAYENELRFHLAQALRNQGRQTDVVELEQTFAPDSPEGHASRAFTLHNAGDYAGARWHYEQERAMRSPDGDGFPLAECLGYLGRLYLDQGRLETAERLIDESMAMNERLSESRGSSIAASLLALGAADASALRFSESLRHYEDAHALYLDIHGTDDVFMVELCRLEVSGLLEDAAAVGDGLVTNIPEPRGSFNTSFIEAIQMRNRARILLRAGAVDAAFAMIDASLAVEEVDDDYHLHSVLAKAGMLSEVGDVDDALSLVEEALRGLLGRSAGRSAEAPLREARIECLLDLGRPDEAAVELARLRELREGYPAESPPVRVIARLQERIRTSRSGG